MAQTIPSIPTDDQPKSPMKFMLLCFGLPLVIIVGLFVLMSHL